jgi:hypothetical protein
MLSGWAGSGKDTAASILVEQYGFQRVAFADALKIDATQRSGIPLDAFHSAAKDKLLQTPCPAFPTAKTPRDILLQLALQMRAENPDIYADSIICHIVESAKEQKFVVSDWRYRREAMRIQEMLPYANIIRVRIHRPGIVASSDLSEHDLDNEKMDLIIENNSGLSDLESQINDKLISTFKSLIDYTLGCSS